MCIFDQLFFTFYDNLFFFYRFCSKIFLKYLLKHHLSIIRRYAPSEAFWKSILGDIFNVANVACKVMLPDRAAKQQIDCLCFRTQPLLIFQLFSPVSSCLVIALITVKLNTPEPANQGHQDHQKLLGRCVGAKLCKTVDKIAHSLTRLYLMESKQRHLLMSPFHQILFPVKKTQVVSHVSPNVESIGSQSCSSSAY